jgi:uncharacterized membrane protein YedE/YeeE
MPSTSILMPLTGGLLIGLSATFLLLLNGRIAGISSIVGGLWPSRRGNISWRWLFTLGLLAGGGTLWAFHPDAFGQTRASLAVLAFSGLLVGFGAGISNGCTSGHGVCGLSRRSLRCLVATLVFIATAMATVYLANHVFVQA